MGLVDVWKVAGGKSAAGEPAGVRKFTRPRVRARRRTRRGSLLSEPFVLLGVVLVVLYFGRQILIPLAFALTLNFLLWPAVEALEKLRVGRLPSVLLAMILLCSVVGGVGYVVAKQLLQVIDDMPNYRENIHARMEAIHMPRSGAVADALSKLRDIRQEVSGTTPAPPPPVAEATERDRGKQRAKAAATRLSAAPEAGPTPVTIVTPPTSEREYLRGLVMPVLAPLGTTGMVLVFAMYMQVKREDLRNRLLLLAGMGRLNVMTQALNDAADRISKYLVMNALVNASYGVLFGLGLFLIGVPNATLWGALIAILRVVPYVGTLAGAVMPLAFTLAVFTTWWQPLAVMALFGVLEVVVSNVIEPWLYGAHTGISPLALLTTAIAWTLLWGWPGLVLSTPLTVGLIVLGRYLPQMGFLHILLGDEAELAPEAQFYERLLAMDQSEAHSIADKFVEGRPLVELYDGVLLPALSLAELDRHKGALDEVRASFLFQSATELIAEMSEYRVKQAQGEDAPSPHCISRTSPVVCVPVNDQADEIVATMLSQLLEQAGHKTMLLPPVALSDEILQKLSEERGTTICISALPPFAFVHARALCHRIREHLPDNCIVIGLWGAQDDSEVLRERFGHGMANRVVTSLKSALEVGMNGTPTGPMPQRFPEVLAKS